MAAGNLPASGAHGAGPEGPRISHLKRRQIQGPLVARLIRAFGEKMGHDKAVEVATAAIRADAIASGKMLAEKYEGSSMAALARVVREEWAEDGAMTLRFLAETDQALSFDVIRCGYAEAYEALGIRDLGFCLSCNRDGSFATGFNPRMRLVRTQTIMQGAPYCDFRFTLE
jgi:hypothetical protein